ncbi:hypothetical protein MGYG_01826 [Nannizzia gypsea CBS 118893]|uniref:Uncharacterized protein n=1 Tax=Arthroderma gypseum (strain ATCC MYA-4604 / CBS 118893) TaxID=535722 RepID=E5R3W4_ARTGP|nr:hypothetical protein MGYG_01826 [Nannizzia gypsea CBS 118893]EFQ98810.1 hypothetical protein MGYG_01826 [Nannizzia gypsea CBS 118893]
MAATIARERLRAFGGGGGSEAGDPQIPLAWLPKSNPDADESSIKGRPSIPGRDRPLLLQGKKENRKLLKTAGDDAGLQ